MVAYFCSLFSNHNDFEPRLNKTLINLLAVVPSLIRLLETTPL